jgi:hypothetical protein
MDYKVCNKGKATKTKERQMVSPQRRLTFMLRTYRPLYVKQGRGLKEVTQLKYVCEGWRQHTKQTLSFRGLM